MSIPCYPGGSSRRLLQSLLIRVGCLSFFFFLTRILRPLSAFSLRLLRPFCRFYPFPPRASLSRDIPYFLYPLRLLTFIYLPIP